MKIIKQSWETRYKELAIEVVCEDCGAKFIAEGKDDDFKVVTHPVYTASTAIAVTCPGCAKNILVSSIINKKDSELVDFIKERQEPQN